MSKSVDTKDVSAFFEDTQVLRDLLPETKTQLLKRCGTRTIAKGAALVRSGDAADTIYFVLTGRFMVVAGGRPIATITEGEPIGELGFFSGGDRTADVMAARDSTVLSLTRDDYDAIAKSTPDLADKILKSMAERLSHVTGASQTLTPQAGRITCVVPVTGQTFPDGFLDQLRRAMAIHPGWAVYDATDAQDIGKTTDDYLAWINRNEVADAHVVLIASNLSAQTPWDAAVHKVADVTFLVATNTDADHAPGAEERALLQGAISTDVHLVICRASLDQKITRTRDWLQDRDVGLHHHVALDSPANFARLARFVTGTATGLVLCGGGAFGSAHLGAIKAMQERGIAFDMVGGTSIGSAMAGVLGMEMDPGEAIDICQDMFLRQNAMRRYTAPVYSVVDPHRLDDLLQTHYRGFEIEDMPINFFAAATSMTFNDLKVLRRGPLWKAVRASTSLPGLFPPMVMDDGEILVDGGLLDNVPVTVMRGLKAGRNVIFNFGLGSEWRTTADYSALPGRWKSLAIMLGLRKPLYPRFPTMFAVLVRSMVVGARRLMSQTDLKDDVLIEIKPIKGMGFLDWKKAKRQFDIAYAEMSAVLEDLNLAEAGDDMARKIDKVADHFGETSE